MNFTSADYFTMLAQERSFTRAAGKLHVTQQTLSAHIANLERELGCQLVVRDTPLKLTYAGEVLLRYATGLQATRDAMVREFGDIAHNHTGVLRVGIAPTRGRAVLPEAICAFHRSYPNIRIDVVEGTNETLHAALAESAIDIAVALFPTAPPGAALVDFYQEEVALLVRKSCLRAALGSSAAACEEALRNGDFRALARIPLLLATEGDITNQVAHRLIERARVGAPIVRATSGNVETLLALCLRGEGACFCPKNLLPVALQPRQLASLVQFDLGREGSYQIRFAYQAKTYQWSAIDAFIRCARESA